jgi:hypothetical protein
MHASIGSFDSTASVRVATSSESGRVTVSVDPTRPREGTFDVTLPPELWVKIVEALTQELAPEPEASAERLAELREALAAIPPKATEPGHGGREIYLGAERPAPVAGDPEATRVPRMSDREDRVRQNAWRDPEHAARVLARLREAASLRAAALIRRADAYPVADCPRCGRATVECALDPCEPWRNIG